MKIAVASNNGQDVNLHFGQAKSFYIYETAGSTLKELEKRETDSYCAHNAPKDHSFSKDRFTTVYEVIKDCELVVVQAVGDVPAAKLKEKGIKPFIFSGKIEEILNNL